MFRVASAILLGAVVAVACECDTVLCVIKDAVVMPRKVCMVSKQKRGDVWYVIPCEGPCVECDATVPVGDNE